MTNRVHQKNIRQILIHDVNKVAVIGTVCKSANIKKTINNFKTFLN